MKNTFMTTTKSALVDLTAAQARHARLRSRADRRLEAAKARHFQEVMAAAQIEADAWQMLLAIPGVSIATAAAMLQVSESTVSRWVARGSRPTAFANGEVHARTGGAS